MTRSCAKLCSLLSDPLKGVTYVICRYTKSDMKLGAKASIGVLRYERGIGYDHIGWFDDASSCRRFLSSMLKGVK